MSAAKFPSTASIVRQFKKSRKMLDEFIRKREAERETLKDYWRMPVYKSKKGKA